MKILSLELPEGQASEQYKTNTTKRFIKDQVVEKEVSVMVTIAAYIIVGYAIYKIVEAML